MLNEKWDERLKMELPRVHHERAMEELTMRSSPISCSEETRRASGARASRRSSRAPSESDETKKQMEEDVDLEIEDLKEKYERSWRLSARIALRLKGENGIMRKKFTALQKDIEDQKDEIQGLFDDKKELHEHIASLEKDIAGLKKEIRERDETIGDKEKRIYDLKKKNQELEKFKFVLDYKIKELKKQIEPREQDIMDMKEQIQRDGPRVGALPQEQLQARPDHLRPPLKLVGMQKEILKQRLQARRRDGARRAASRASSTRRRV